MAAILQKTFFITEISFKSVYLGPVDNSYSAFVQVMALPELMMNQSSDTYMRYQVSSKLTGLNGLIHNMAQKG